ncbi:hypothetical protein QG37_07370 [Candidozyma auris]|uniref:Uncharacterized protein n=1 Tax=Candidozyma auris TaxID=498019 RepID=A0A0L0NQA5_CANAR|nr:hypothetical protein QG37_07370 [[Candida] auris]
MAMAEPNFRFIIVSVARIMRPLLFHSTGHFETVIWVHTVNPRPLASYEVMPDPIYLAFSLHHLKGRSVKVRWRNSLTTRGNQDHREESSEKQPDMLKNSA